MEVILKPIDAETEVDQSLQIEQATSPSQNHPTPPRHGSNNLSPRVPSVRIKAPPVCLVPALRKMNMSAEILSQWCFGPQDLLLGEGEEDASEDEAEDSVINDQIPLPELGLFEDEKISWNQWANFKKAILRRTESRNGRDLQRFATDRKTGYLLRLTTGSVPIMRDGKILLISSSRKEEWILPKGGWESDESLKVSALRETYEEGGILGTLGPMLTVVEYETRKAKKRRLEMECLRKKYGHSSESVAGLPASMTKDAVSHSSAVSIHSANSSICPSEDDVMQGSGHSRDLFSPDRGIVAKTDADTASLGSFSDSSSASGHVRMTMFPLYVLEVRENWPENGRARKVVDIDTAIEMMKSRPEFHQVLVEVKEKGYHLNPCGRIQSGQGGFVDKI